MSFDEKLRELKDLTDKLETGKLSLEESLLAYERGVVLAKEANELLRAGEMRIEVLTQEGKPGKLGKEGKS